MWVAGVCKLYCHTLQVTPSQLFVLCCGPHDKVMVWLCSTWEWSMDMGTQVQLTWQRSLLKEQFWFCRVWAPGYDCAVHESAWSMDMVSAEEWSDSVADHCSHPNCSSGDQSSGKWYVRRSYAILCVHTCTCTCMYCMEQSYTTLTSWMTICMYNVLLLYIQVHVRTYIRALSSGYSVHRVLKHPGASHRD